MPKLTKEQKARVTPMQNMVTNELAEDIFGVNLQNQNRAFYVPLQLFDVLWGIQDAKTKNVNVPEIFADLDDKTKILFTRRSHDFARRLLNQADEIEHSNCLYVVSEPDSNKPPCRICSAFANPEKHQEIIEQVLSALTVPDLYAHGRQVQANRRHFRPYLGELMHHDFAPVSKKERNAGRNKDADFLNFERVYYRGAGLLAYDLYRTDEDHKRRDEIKYHLAELVEDSPNDPLGRLISSLQKNDALKSETANYNTHNPIDKINLSQHQTHWAELLRKGTYEILTGDTGRIKKVDHLMYWIPFCISRHALEQATKITSETEHDTLIVDMGVSPRLKKLSQQSLSSHQNILRRAPISAADHVLKTGTLANQKLSSEQKAILEKIVNPDDEDVKTEQFQNSASNTSKFYVMSMAHIGALNHNTGVRNYTFKDLGLLEAIVYATITDDEEVTLDEFCELILGKNLRMITDINSADESILEKTDTNDLEKNKKALSDMLLSLGLLTNYSDAVKKVRRR